MSVVIVDDDSAVLDSLSATLTLAGFSVKTFSSAQDYLDVLHQNNPDCLIIDLHMPRIGGIVLIDRLKKLGESTPVILVSGNMDHTVRTRAGVARYLKKPFTGSTLIQTIHSVVAESQK